VKTVVGLEMEDAQARRMAALGVREADLEETFVRSGGRGGQNVNKTSTCVVLRHGPSGVQVKCQTSRQQGYNRWLARERLLDELDRRRRHRAEAERSRVEKLRRQKRPRSVAAKARMLEEKARRSRVKALRRRTEVD
jgi:protein subunit release factor B